MVKTIEKYFGDWEPNPDIPVLSFPAEKEITEPVEKEVFGLEAEQIAMGWRLPAARDLKNTAIADIAGSILYNGQAGLIDLDVNQQQKVLSLYAGNSTQPDYSSFIVMGRPKQGQTLEEVRDIALEEIAKLRSGDFDEDLIPATINNLKLGLMRSLESNDERAQFYIDAFINGIEWKDAAKELERLESVTKEDVVAWACEFLKENGYAVVYKRQGEDTTVQKISAPAITPIESNRDKQSAFLADIKASTVKPIEPVFIDFDKDMSKFDLAQGVDVLYKRNKLNDIFDLNFIFNEGSETDPALGLAFDYLSYLGTPDMSAEDIASRMYALACSFRMSAGASQSTLYINGLSENMEEAVRIVEELIANAQPDEDILAMLKDNIIKSRSDSKKNQRSCFSALQRYVTYGPEFIERTTLDNDAIMALTSEELLAKVRDVVSKGHEILYYGPMSESDARTALAECHKTGANPVVIPESFPARKITEGNSVVLAQYDAKQIYYMQISNRGETYSPDCDAYIDLYNEYFGGGMNTIVFQEMREARGLAYSASAYLNYPGFKDDNFSFSAFIATQNDKMQTAVEAFDGIIEDMPESQAAFDIAKEAIISRMRTQRTTGAGVLRNYIRCRRLGLDEPVDKAEFAKLQGLTLDDVKKTQQEWVAGRDYTYMILGDIKDLDTDYLKTLGPVKIVTLEDIFGY